MKNIVNVILSSWVFLFFISVQAQDKKLVIKSKRNEDRTVTFFYEKTDPGSLIVSMKFRDVENAQASDVFKTIKGRSGTFHTLEPLNPKKGIRYGYSYRYTRGVLKAKVDKEFIYALPYKEGVKSKVRELRNLGEHYLDEEVNQSWKSFQFLFKKADTICAIRKGMVVEVVDDHLVYKKGTRYSNRRNKIIIQHEDGTFARYSVLKKGGMMVKVGDKVYPQTPIAIAGSYGDEDINELRLLVYYVSDASYLKKEYDSKNKRNPNRSTFINPTFFLNENTGKLEPKNVYVSQFSKEILEKEMSKREQKRYYKNKAE